MDARVDERRRARRQRTIDEHGIRGARVRPGHPAAVIDISAHGALVETPYRLLPGSSVDLQLEVVESRITVRGRVLRCAVASLRPWAIVYRAAILFERALRWLGDEKRLPAANDARGVVTTHHGR